MVLKSTKLRELFKEKEIIRVVGAHNGLTAKLVEKNGFDCVWASGFEIATSHAVPDANILTMSDLLRVSENINDSVSIPVIVDCDTGFGNSINVINLVKKFEKAGIAGISIEDKKFPKVNSYVPGRQELAPIAEFCGKIMAAKHAQENPDFMVFARVEALIAGWGMEEAFKRAEIYADTGADGIFIHSKESTGKEILEFAKKWKKLRPNVPLIICPTAYPNITEDHIKDLPIKAIIYANHGIRASIKAINEVLSEIKKAEGIHTINDKIVPMKDVFDLQNMPQMKELESKFVQSGANVIILAAGRGGDESLSEILKDRSVCMLDLNGKSLIKRNIEILNSLGLNNINIITGYKSEIFKNLQDVNLIHNPDYKEKYILHSFMKCSDKFDKKVLMIFSDIIFEKELIENLLKTNEDIVIVIDSSFMTSNISRPLDIVIAKNQPIIKDRIVKDKKLNEILKIGKKVSKEEANFEFVGMALISDKILKLIKEIYKEHLDSGKEIQGKKVENADFVDMIQELIDRGIKVSALEIYKGWMEINSFKDYKDACGMIK